MSSKIRTPPAEHRDTLQLVSFRRLFLGLKRSPGFTKNRILRLILDFQKIQTSEVADCLVVEPCGYFLSRKLSKIVQKLLKTFATFVFSSILEFYGKMFNFMI